MEYKVGDVLKGDYEVIDIMRGGLGIVYIVYHPKWKEKAAVKSFQEEYIYNDKVVEDFHHEAEVWVKLGEHENIVEAFFVAELDYRPHIFMEYVDGGNLRERLEKGGFSIPEALYFAIQFCDGMIYANGVDLGGGRRGIVHRDVKPSNMMLTKEAVLKITDFGLVKALGRSTAERPWGTPEYMSPEQFETMDVDQSSDIYSFGVVLYEMLTGRRPFPEPENPEDSALRWEHHRRYHVKMKPSSPRQINPLIPEELEHVVMRCLEKQPKNRYQSFEVLRQELMEIYHSRFGQMPEVRNRIRSLTVAELRNKGSSLLSLRKPEKAIPCYDKALEIDPTHADTWIGKGVALGVLRRHWEAIECFNKALDIEPRHAHAWFFKGRALDSLGRHEEATKCFDIALEIDPKHAYAWYGKGAALYRLGRYGEAIRCYDRTLELDPRHAEAWHFKGVALFQLGRLEDAIGYYDKALEINPRYADAWVGKGLAFFRLGRYGEAIGCYDEALKADSRHAHAWGGKGLILHRLGKAEEALKCFRKAAEIDPTWRTRLKGAGLL
mgnify:CR=1 FL=1